jgi:hypothetical protein
MLDRIVPELDSAAEPFVRPVPSGAVKVLPRWAEDEIVTKWRLRYRCADEAETAVAGDGIAVVDDGSFGDGMKWIELELRPFTRELPLTGLSHGRSHLFKVCIETDEGWSNWSNVVTCVVPSPELPAKPAAVFATVKDDTTASIRWTRPIDYAASVSCGRLSRYRLRVAWVWPLTTEEDHRDFCKEFVVDHDQDTFDVPNLECCRDYRFQVCAENITGWGEWSDPSAVINMPLPVPLPPPQPTLRRATHHSAVIQWQHPSPGGAPIESFRFRYTTSTDWTTDITEIHDVPHNQSQYVVNGLKPGMAYLFQVRAVNKYGMGIWSDSSIPMKTVDGQAPSKIKDLTVPHIYKSFVTLQWPPAEDNGYEVTHHLVRYSFQPDMVDVVEPPTISVQRQGGYDTCALRHLEKGKTYYFQVVAFNKLGMTEWSDPVSVMLPEKTRADQAAIAGS